MTRDQEIVELRKSGMMQKDIATRFGLTRARVGQICEAMGLPVGPRGGARPGSKGRKRGTWKQKLLAAGDLPWRQYRDLEKQIAREELGKAIRRGEVKKPSNCERCRGTFAAKRIHGHHTNYEKPLDVQWLCQDCHFAAHGKARRPA